MNLKIRSICAAVLLAGAFAASQAAAQSAPAYPTKPIRLIVQSPPGAAPDVVARIIVERLAPALGQPIVVVNRTGASGTIALAAVAKAAPDGYTLGTMSPLQTVAPSLLPQVPYDTARDLAPVRQTTQASLILVVRSSSSLRSLTELIAAAQAQPGRLVYASGGNGTPLHLAAEVFKLRAGVDIYHVPYKGAVAAVAALLGDQVDLVITTAVTVGAPIRSGRLRAIATTGPVPMADFPAVPTLAGLGFADFDVRDWQGIVVPSKTPKRVVERLAAEVAKVLAQPEIKERFAGVGVEPVADSSPKAFGALIQSELARWAKVVREAGIRVD